MSISFSVDNKILSDYRSLISLITHFCRWCQTSTSSFIVQVLETLYSMLCVLVSHKMLNLQISVLYSPPVSHTHPPFNFSQAVLLFGFGVYKYK